MDDYYDNAIDFGNLYRAMKRCCRNVRWKDSTVGYEANGLKNTYTLRQDLLNGRYKISPYQHFVIYEPKMRPVDATRMRDRQYQISLIENGLYDDLTESFIHNNGACQKGRGTDYTLDCMTAALRRYYNVYGTDGWVLKCDIKKFFPSTPHATAKAASGKRIRTPRAAMAVSDVIDSFGEDGIGVGLGSPISQLVELAVLDDLDHFIKEQLRIKHYVRYMDDFILIHPEREYLRQCLQWIQEHVENLGLSLNSKTTLYPLRQGVKLMNWRFVITDTGRILRLADSRKSGKQRRKLRKLWAKEKQGEVAPGTTKASLDAWLSNMARGDTWAMRKNMIEFYNTLVRGDADHEQRSP